MIRPGPTNRVVDREDQTCHPDGVGLPSGTVTFMFTDVEGSTRLWETEPEVMQAALSRHDDIVRSTVEQRGGYVFATGGDGFAAAFARPADALEAAVEVQQRLDGQAVTDACPLRVRMGLHTGVAEERDGDYFGPAVNRPARLMALGHGGQILCSSATAELLDGVKLVDLGEHQLRDLSSPVHVFQVGGEVFPALQALDSYPSNLPAQTGSFVGRSAELAEVIEALESSRVVTLTGVGGVGKTRLALHAAADMLHEFRDGAWLVELAPVLDPDLLLEVVARAIDVPERQGLSLESTLTEFLRNKRMLLVVDNCEHLLDAVAGLVGSVLGSCPHLRVLANQPGGIEGRGRARRGRAFVEPAS